MRALLNFTMLLLLSIPALFRERNKQATPSSAGIAGASDGIAERWVGSAHRELLDHVVVLNEKHLHRLLREYVQYYNADRVHTRLQDSPMGRPAECRPLAKAHIIGKPRVGGLQHRYAWREAA